MINKGNENDMEQEIPQFVLVALKDMMEVNAQDPPTNDLKKLFQHRPEIRAKRKAIEDKFQNEMDNYKGDVSGILEIYNFLSRRFSEIAPPHIKQYLVQNQAFPNIKQYSLLNIVNKKLLEHNKKISKIKNLTKNGLQ